MIALIALLVALAGALLGFAVHARLAARTLAESVAGERARLVAELDASGGRAAAILDAMDTGIVALDAHRAITTVNRAAITLLALPPGPEGGRLPEEVLGLLPAPGAGDLEVALPGARTVSVRVTPMDDGGQVIVLHDITAVRRAEQIRRDFAANASHELRTPVAVLKANAETLLDGALDDPVAARRFVDAMHRHAGRLSDLLEDLLDLARIEAGRYPVDPVALSVDDALRRALDVVGRRAQDEGVQVTHHEAPGLVLRADARALDQVLVNLTDNAIKYTPAGGAVQLRAVRRGRNVRIEVQDDGPGIPLASRARLFERFYRVDPGRDRSIGGTGLGLAIVKHLTASMGGSTGMDPVSPHGALFWVELPGSPPAQP